MPQTVPVTLTGAINIEEGRRGRAKASSSSITLEGGWAGGDGQGRDHRCEKEGAQVERSEPKGELCGTGGARAHKEDEGEARWKGEGTMQVGQWRERGKRKRRSGDGCRRAREKKWRGEDGKGVGESGTGARVVREVTGATK